MRRALLAPALLPCALLVASCGAEGATEEDLAEYGFDASRTRSDAATDASRDGSSDGGSRDGSASDASTPDGGPGDGAPRPDGAQDGSVDASIDSGVDAGAPPVDPCAYPNSCASGRTLGSVRGDEGTDFLRGTGATSEWLLVRVTEASSSISAVDLRARFRLTHHPQTTFDLYVYRAGNSSSSTRNCSSVTGTGSRTTTTNVTTATLAWEDTRGVFSGIDDDANVMVEIRHVSGPCGAGREWILEVDGNVN